jgi:hypothetical protein
MTRSVPPISPRNLAAIYRAERGPSWSQAPDLQDGLRQATKDEIAANRAGYIDWRIEGVEPTAKSWSTADRYNESLAFRIFMWGTWPLIVVILIALAVTR